MATTPIRLSITDLPAHLATLKAELQEGHTVELVDGDEIVGEVHARPGLVSAEQQALQARTPMPDFMARLKAMWGERPLEVDTTTWVREDRDGDDVS